MYAVIKCNLLCDTVYHNFFYRYVSKENASQFQLSSETLVAIYGCGTNSILIGSLALQRSNIYDLFHKLWQCSNNLAQILVAERKRL